MSTVQEIGEAIEHLNVRDQLRLLHDLPAHLKIQPDDVGWLKATEPTFEFWNNPEDAWHEEELAERERKIESGEAKFVEWEKAKADIRRRNS